MYKTITKDEALQQLKDRIQYLKQGIIAGIKFEVADLSLLVLLDDVNRAYGDDVAANCDKVIFKTLKLGYDMSGEFVMPYEEEDGNPLNDPINTITYLSAMVMLLARF